MFTNNQIATKALELMLNSKKNLYVTGDAGTGKSTLLKHFLEKTDKKTVVLAPTGMAAINAAGETIHSFCRFGTEDPWRLLEEGKIHKLKDNRRVKNLEVLVLDEISMVRSDMLDSLDKFFRLNKEKPRLPFGGLQLIFFGDHFQLPPVLRSSEKAEFNSKYKSEYFFGAKCFKSLNLQFIKLTHNYRQSELEFIKFLNYLRYGVSTGELISWVNNKFYNKKIETDLLPITITAINKDANDKNLLELSKLPAKEIDYKATISGSFGQELYPTEKYLTLKQGAQVMFIKNDPDKRWVNGTIGTVHKLNKSEVIVMIGDQLVDVDFSSWQAYKYRFDEEKGQVVKETVGEFVQYPLKLAWAVTIHKSQGQTFDNCVIDLGRGAFIFGQTYVAFSRCRTMNGVHLAKPIKPTDIKADPQVITFDKSLNWNDFEAINDSDMELV